MPLTTSLSAPDVSELHRNEVIGAILSSCGPSLLSRSLLGQVGQHFNKPSAFTVSFNALKAKFLQTKRRVRSLETANSELKTDNQMMRAEISLLQDELQTTRINLYDEVERRRKDALHIKQSDDRIKDLSSQIQRYGEFIHVLAGIGLNNPLYHGALSAMSGLEAEEALVTSIMEASKDKSSPWSRIIPSVVGPRSPENYVSALDLTLRTRADLRKREKISNFWGKKAKSNPDNANLLSPSSSDLSGVCDQLKDNIDPKKEPAVLDDMLEALKNDTGKPSSPCTDFPVPYPSFESMAKWVTEANEEERLAALAAAAAASSGNIDLEHHSQSVSTTPSENIGILKKVDGCGRIGKTTPSTPHKVRFDLYEDNDMLPTNLESDVEEPSVICSSNTSSDNCDNQPAVLKDDNLDVAGTSNTSRLTYSDSPVDQEFKQLTEEPSDYSVSRPLTTSAARTGSCSIKSIEREASSNTTPSMEEYFIVKAGEDIPHMSVHLMREPFATRLPLSVSETGLPSSGSEYSEMSADATEEANTTLEVEQLTAFNHRTSHIPNNTSLRPPLSSTVNVFPAIAEKLSTIQRNEQVEIQPLDSVQRSPSLEYAVKNGPRLFENESNAMDGKLPEKSLIPKPHTKRSIFRKVSTSPPSSPRKSSSPLSPTSVKVTTLRNMPFNRQQTNTLAASSKNIDLLKSRSPPPATSPPTRRTSPQLLSVNTIKRRPSPTQFQRPLKSASNGEDISKLNTPRLTPKRPGLQSVDLNLPSAKSNNMSSTSEADTTGQSDLFKSKITKPSARDLGKRRGVIMTEKLNIGSTISAPIPAKRTMIIPVTPQMEVHGLPRPILHWVSTESMEGESQVTIHQTEQTNSSTAMRDCESNDLLAIPSSANTAENGIPPSSTGSFGSPDLSRFDAGVSELVASMSDSDLGSLEMTGDSDFESNCSPAIGSQEGHIVHTPQSLSTLPHVCKAILDEPSDAFGPNRSNEDDRQGKGASSEFQSAPEVVTPRALPRLRAPTLISATFGSGRSAKSDAVASSSSSSLSSSSSFSFTPDSPTRSKSTPKRSSLANAIRPPQSHHISPTYEKRNESSASRPVQSPQPTPLSHNLKHTGLAKSSIPNPRVHKRATSTVKVIEPTAKGDKKDEQPAISSAKSKVPQAGSSDEKSSRILTQSKPATGPADDPSTPESKSWISQNIFNRFSNSDAKKSSGTNTSTKPSISQPPPSGSNASPIKPRSNTINTLLPSFSRSSPHNAQALAPPSPSTKPRSNTVNTYSPVNRSPLSQHVTNNSLEFQSRSSHPGQPPTVLPSLKSTISKPIPPSRIAQTTSKAIAPLRVIKKPSPSRIPPTSPRNNGPAPPTAAFMIPRLPVTNTRRASSSVTPLIPSSANGVISPSQCRSLLRNSLTMVR